MGVARHVEQAIDLRAFGGERPDRRDRRPQGPRRPRRWPTGSRSPTSRPGTPSSSSLALAWAETLGAFDLFVGVNCVDYSGYPDCRPEFLRAFEALANLATRAGVEGPGRFRVHAPLLTLTKEQIIRRGRELGVDFGLTHSCYDPTPEGLACGRCDSCRLRLAAFDTARAGRPGRLRRRLTSRSSADAVEAGLRRLRARRSDAITSRPTRRAGRGAGSPSR